jgi:hypothetical protein
MSVKLYGGGGGVGVDGSGGGSYVENTREQIARVIAA